jgi:hypothetical protein
MKIGRLILATLSILWTIENSSVVLGCTCVKGDASVQQDFDQYDAVFMATVIAIKATELGGENIDGHQTISASEVTLKVSYAWKGIGANESTIIVSPGSCGYGFQYGWTYMVWAVRSEGKLNVGLCSRTKPWEQATEDHITLTKIKRPTRIK